MRTVLITLAAAASALAVASPASAQWAPQPQVPYGYGAPAYGAPAYGYGAPAYGAPAYGYGHRFGHVRALQARVDSIQRRIAWLDRRNVLSHREANRLRQQSRKVEVRLHRASRYGLNPYEAREIEHRVARLEHRVHREAMDRNGRWGRPGYGHAYDDDRDDGRDGRHGRWSERRDDDDD